MAESLIFLDTEFTAFHQPQLISIGLAAATGEEFYAEVPYPLALCSEFVRDIVIPLLGKDPLAPCPFDELHVRLRNWFTVVKSEATLVVCFDSEYDRALFFEIFDGRPPEDLRFREVGTRNVNELLRYEYHMKNALSEHHALNDACALRYAFREARQFP